MNKCTWLDTYLEPSSYNTLKPRFERCQIQSSQRVKFVMRALAQDGIGTPRRLVIIHDINFISQQDTQPVRSDRSHCDWNH